ncbi:TIGR03086 family protein [Pilimelia anulata]|uniref:TIGR03086 family protein n=1 Tax=Pilimelia anulata TaxID=53371 RepID=A0A8J3BET7_9ACTN|nr:TIGR03086 family metal-binding protein [Pilimelia anulata]GGK08645.1 TIGR03086 family protein [Pilimelia anulata]
MSALADERLPELLDRAVAATTDVIRRVRPDRYADPTPCRDLDVRALLNHLIGGQRFFAASAAGETGDPAAFAADHLAADTTPADLYADGGRAALAAFAGPGALSRAAKLPDGSDGPPLADIYLLEQVVHGWDVAAAIGADRGGDPAAVAAVHDGWYGKVPQHVRDLGTVFGPEQPCPPDAAPADRLAAYLGRRIP